MMCLKRLQLLLLLRLTNTERTMSYDRKHLGLSCVVCVCVLWSNFIKRVLNIWRRSTIVLTNKHTGAREKRQRKRVNGQTPNGSDGEKNGTIQWMAFHFYFHVFYSLFGRNCFSFPFEKKRISAHNLCVFLTHNDGPT